MKILYILIFLFAYITAHSQNEWNKLEPFGGSKRERAVGFTIGGRGYVGTGQDTAEAMTRDFWEFDPGTNSWTQKADFGGVGRRNAIGFSIGNKGYIGTGMSHEFSFSGDELADFWEYDPATNAWTQKAPYPGAGGAGVYYATGFGINGKGYICGGKIGPSNYSSELWEYNPLSNTWMPRANFPGGTRYGLVSFVVNNKAYVGTGTDENAFNNDLWCFDPSTNTWVAKANMPGSARFSCAAFAIGWRGFIVLGSDGGYKDELWEYNAYDDTWVQRASFGGGARRSGVAFAIGSKGYAGTGKGESGCRRDFWEYNTIPLTGLNVTTGEVPSMSFYPNPMHESSTLQLPSGIMNTEALELLIYDSSGKLVRVAAVEGQHLVITRESLSKGLYFCFISSNNRIISNGKLIVQ